MTSYIMSLGKWLSILCLLGFSALSHTVNAQSLEKMSAYWLHGGKMIVRSMDNALKLYESSDTQFESWMKDLGANITYEEDFCILAAEQMSRAGIESDGNLNPNHFLYFKCPDRFLIMWYGPNTRSGFRYWKPTLEAYYSSTLNGVRYYRVNTPSGNYNFQFRRNVENSVNVETLIITKG